MRVHDNIDGWDEDEFDHLYNKFEDDEQDETKVQEPGDEDGFEKKEFRRLVMYIISV